MPRTGVNSRTETFLAVRYLVTAGSVALGYLGLFALGLLAGFHYFVAILIAQVVTIAGAFPLYRRFVFKSRGRLFPDFLRFLTVWSSGAVAGIVVTPFLVELVHLHPLMAQILAVAAISIATFIAHRFFTFRANPFLLRAAEDPVPEVGNRTV